MAVTKNKLFTTQSIIIKAKAINTQNSALPSDLLYLIILCASQIIVSTNLCCGNGGELPLFNSMLPEGRLVAGNSPWWGIFVNGNWPGCKPGQVSQGRQVGFAQHTLAGALMSLLGLMTRTRTDTWNKEDLLLCDFPPCPLGESAGDYSQKTEEGEGGGREGEICLKCPSLITLNSFFFNNQWVICLLIYGRSGSLLRHKGSLLVRVGFL